MQGADAMALLTEWNEFRALDPARIRALLKTPIVIDLRNVYSPADMVAAGLDYRSIGRPVTAHGSDT
jgi:UDPglucose 6-dehydrogenase